MTGLATPDAPVSTPTSAARILALDVARGGALAAMIAFHFTWDLDFFAWLPAGALGSGFQQLGHVIAAVFLLIVGASLALATRNGFAPKPYFRRVAYIALAACAVTAATKLAIPQQFIFFGILHCIAVASLVAAPFLFLPLPWVVAIGVGAFAAPFLFAAPALNAPWIQWLGFGTSEPITNDWAPLFPALGFVLLGSALLRRVARTGALQRIGGWRPRAALARLAASAGRHSLAIYLLHQPVLLGLLFAAGYALGRAAPSDALGFQRSCESQCAAHGSDRAFCTNVCGCVVGFSQSTPYWRHVLTNELTASERRSFDSLVRECFEGASARTTPGPPAAAR